MKPFDIQKARLGERVVQENGNEARYVGESDRVITRYPLIFQTFDGERWEINFYTKGGKRGKFNRDERDLVMLSVDVKQL